MDIKYLSNRYKLNTTAKETVSNALALKKVSAKTEQRVLEKVWCCSGSTKTDKDDDDNHEDEAEDEEEELAS